MSDPHDKKPGLSRYLEETGYALGVKHPRLDVSTPGVEFFSPALTFMDRFLRGEASAEQIADHIDVWHLGTEPEMELHAWLGMTEAEYAAWVEDPSSLKATAERRRSRIDEPPPGVSFGMTFSAADRERSEQRTFRSSPEAVLVLPVSSPDNARPIFYSHRGIPLIWNYRRPNEVAVLTMECSAKWYELFLIWPDKITTAHFGVLEPHRGDESAYRDHVPNPRAVVRYARANGYALDNNAIEMIIGRWELECSDRYDDIVEDLA